METAKVLNNFEFSRMLFKILKFLDFQIMTL